MRSKLAWRSVAAGMLLGAAGVAYGQPGGEAAPPSPPAPAEPPARARFANADALLTALEDAGRNLSTFQADVQYTRDFGSIEGNQQEMRRGKLAFRQEPTRSFAVEFDQFIVDQVLRPERRSFAFDGVWLVEKDHESKQMFKRRLVAPGEESVDPLAIGEGPFPLPIGQKKAKILERFEVELRPASDSFDAETWQRAERYFARTHQLRLVPRPGTDEAREYREIRIWYRGEDLLPRLARTINADGGRSEVLLINHRVNEPVQEAFFSTEPPADDWKVQEADLRKPLNPGGGQ